MSLSDDIGEYIDSLSLEKIHEILGSVGWPGQFNEFLPYVMLTDDCSYRQVKSYNPDPGAITNFLYFSTDEEAYQYMLKALVYTEMIDEKDVVGRR